MKKTLSILTLAALVVALLGACSKINERIDGLEKKVDGLENGQIASVKSQMDAIRSSISDLGQIKSDVAALKTASAAQGSDIDGLTEAEEALGERISALEEYVAGFGDEYVTPEWMKVTFSTLEQYEATCDVIAEIDAGIGALDAGLSKDIEECAAAMSEWVNGQLGGYYTAAQVDASLEKMKSDIDAIVEVDEQTAETVDILAAEVAVVKDSITGVKAAIKAECAAAVEAAVKEAEGRLTSRIARAVLAVNTTIDGLKERAEQLGKDIEELTGKITALKGRIQSVSIVPGYDDGSVVVTTDGDLLLTCRIEPVEAVKTLNYSNFSVIVNKVQKTKAVGLQTIGVTEAGFEMNEDKGTVELTVSIADFIPENDEDSTVTDAVNVKTGVTDYTTEFVPVYDEGSSCIAAGTMITMEHGEQKAVEDLEINDVIRTVDHETGLVSSAPVCFIWKTENVSNVFTLTFEGGVEVNVVEEHGFFNREEQKYSFINANNAKDYIGHHFYDADNECWLELKSCKPLNKRVDAYAVITSRHLNHLSNGMLSMCDGSVKVLANIFEYDSQMMFDADKKAANIAEYGLTPLEKVLEYKGFFEADYYDYNLMYLNVAIGKGLTSWDYVKALSDYCEIYVNQ